MLEKNPNAQNVEEIAKQVGVGAVVFQELSNSRIKDYTFSWSRTLSFEGETGPYVQYTHARCCAVLRKANEEATKNINYDLLQSEKGYEGTFYVNSDLILYDNDGNGCYGSHRIHRPLLLQGRIWLPLHIKLGAEDKQQDGLGADGSSCIHISPVLLSEIRTQWSGDRKLETCPLYNGRTLPSSLFPAFHHRSLLCPVRSCLLLWTASSLLPKN